MATPGKYLLDLAQYLETKLIECGRDISCVDLDYGAHIGSPALENDCNLKVDVGPNQNYFRAIDLNNGNILYQKQGNGCSAGWRFDGLVRVTAPYEGNPVDCCHEFTPFTYYFTNTVAIVSQALQDWLYNQTGIEGALEIPGEGVQTEYVYAYNGLALTVAIGFTLRVCIPSCEELLAEEAEMKGILDGLKR